MTSILQETPTGLDREAPHPAPPSHPLLPRAFRPDIEGLRAVAVLLVVIYHAGLLNLSGGFIGVDIFFVISGFLITRQLVSGVAAHGVRELPSFYARRIRRLLPASTVVVVATILAAYAFAPALRVKAITVDAVFTTFYGLNYRLAYAGTDYQHQSDAVSPLQHFWSLGVEEQFYVLWPLLIVVAALAGRRYRNVALVIMLLTMAGVSFWYSATTTVANPSWAYFSLHTRAWELAVGGLVALTATGWARLPRWLTNIGGWASVATIIAAAYLLDDSSIYPGVLAAIPVGAAALLLGCGCAPRYHSVERLLGEPVMQGIGKVSYGWYLWHWPMLIIFPYVAGEALGWPRRLEVVFLSLLFAVATYFIVENPARHLRRLNFEWFRTGLALAAVVAVIAVIASNTTTVTGTGIAAQAVDVQVTSKATKQVRAAINNAMTITKAPLNLTPEPAKAVEDYPIGCINKLTQRATADPEGDCTLGDPKATKTFAILGDSHAGQWGTGLHRAAKLTGYKVIMRTKAACPAADVKVYSMPLKRMYDECDQWRPRAITELMNAKPDFVFISQADVIGGNDLSDTDWAKATARTITQFRDAGIGVIMMLDTPLIPLDVPACIAEHLDATQQCNVARKDMYFYPYRHTAVAKAARAAGASVVDPATWLCNKKGCPAIVGNILAWRDGNGHMTSTYSRWLSPVLVTMLKKYRANDVTPSPSARPKPPA